MSMDLVWIMQQDNCVDVRGCSVDCAERPLWLCLWVQCGLCSKTTVLMSVGAVCIVQQDHCGDVCGCGVDCAERSLW